MKKDYTAIQQHYEIRESRYLEQIKSLSNTIDEKDITIAELNLEITKLRSENKRILERLNRLLMYSNISENEKSQISKKSFWKRFVKK